MLSLTAVSDCLLHQVQPVPSLFDSLPLSADFIKTFERSTEANMALYDGSAVLQICILMCFMSPNLISFRGETRHYDELVPPRNFSFAAQTKG